MWGIDVKTTRSPEGTSGIITGWDDGVKKQQEVPPGLHYNHPICPQLKLRVNHQENLRFF